MKKFLTLVIALTLLTACSGDDSPGTTAPPENNTVLLKHYSTEDNTNGIQNWDIEYEGTQMIKLSDGVIQLNYLYTNNLLTDIKTFNGNDASRYIIIDYDQNSKVSKINFFEINGEETLRFEINHLSENKFIKTYYHLDKEFGNETYTLENGNIMKTESKNRLIEYEYDTKNSPRKNMQFSSIFQTIHFDNIGEYSTNNRTKATTYNKKDGTYDEFTYQYTYNSNNYPITKKGFHNGEWYQTINYSYE